MARSRRHVLFYANAPNNSVCFRPVYEALAQDERLCLWLTADSKTHPDAKEFYALQGFDTARVLPRWRARWKRADLYLSPNMAITGRRCRQKAQMFHGVSFKGRPYTENIKKYDFLFTIGPYMKQRFVRDGLFAEGDPRLLEIGMPKTDRLLDGSLERERVRAELGFEDAAPVVLYAPTWRYESSLQTMGRELVEALPKRGLNLLVKLHDHFYDRQANKVDWKAEMERLAHPRMRLVTNFNIIPFLAAADILISDLSSVANEFCLLDRPIVFIDTPLLYQKYERTLDMETWGHQMGTEVRSLEELNAALDDALANPARLSDVRRRVAQDLFYNPGRATAAAADAVRRILELD